VAASEGEAGAVVLITPGLDLRLKTVRPATVAAPPSTLLTGLVSWWKLDEESGTRADSVIASGNDLSDINTVGFAAGKIGNAANLTAASDEMLRRTGGLIDWSGAWTLCGWVKRNGAGETWAGLAGQSGCLVAGYGMNNGAVALLSYDNLNFRLTPTAATLSDDTWGWTCFWHDPNVGAVGTVYAQLNDGSSTSVAMQGTGHVTNTNNFDLGNSTFGQQWNGLIDLSGVWSRVLTSDEKAELYNAGDGVDYPF